jgi:transposase
MEKDKLENECVLHRVYSEDFKRQVIEEYLRTGVSKRELIVKYDIRSKGAFKSWMRQLGYEDFYVKPSSLKVNRNIKMVEEFNGNEPEGDKEALTKRIKELERLLEDERLKSEAYSRMIELAEKELKISIRKKANTR